MKIVAIYCIGLAVGLLLDYTFAIKIHTDVLTALFSVSGIMYSFFTGMIVASGSYFIRDYDFRKTMRTERVQMLKRNTLTFFIPTILYLIIAALPRTGDGYMRFPLSVIFVQILSVIFFCCSSKKLFDLYEDIDDRIHKEIE